MTVAASLQAVEKHYPEFSLGPISFDLEPGKVRALIGPNGAGKTTAMDVLAGLSRPATGTVTIRGHKAHFGDPEWKAQVGYASEQQPFFENWTARRNLTFLASYFPSWSGEAQDALAERFELPLTRRVKELSKGNRVKLALVAALARRPRVLLLDEPTAGLDPLVRTELLDVLHEYLEDGGPAILYSTHILSDLGRLADDLTFIRDGKVVLDNQRHELEEGWRRLTFRHEAARLPVATGELLLDHRTQGTLHAAATPDYQRAVDQLRALGATNIEAQRMPLEEVAVHVLRGASAARGSTHA